ncbi:hypothetical protein FACS1894184_21270 [Clostridia bacterium]|nr:hypothetical protein FACS1894184_21270 [Clostridia bacterium]
MDQRLFGIAPLLHEGVAARLIYALKYMHIRAAAEPLAQSMLDVLPEGFDALVPVPLYHKREQTRGYNQAAVLCDELSRLSGRPVLNALNRTRATHQQMRLAADKRKANVKDAFEAIMPVNGKRLVVVDDVRTTGATALACADALYLGGAVETRLLTATLAIMGDSSDHRYETKDAVVERTTTSATRFDIHGLAAPLY